MYRYIVAMSLNRERLKQQFEDASKPIVQHMIKLLYYPDSSDYSHWKQEIYSFLNDTYKMKGSNKWPSEKFIFTYLQAYNDAIDGGTRKIISKYGNPHSNVSIEDILKAVLEYEKFAAESLSQTGNIYSDELYVKLDEIVNKYSKGEMS